MMSLPPGRVRPPNQPRKPYDSMRQEPAKTTRNRNPVTFSEPNSSTSIPLIPPIPPISQISQIPSIPPIPKIPPLPQSGIELVASSHAPTLLNPTQMTPDSNFLRMRREISSPLITSKVNEKPSYAYNRAELRINTLVSMLSVVIGSAAIVVSISKNDNTNRIVFGLTIAIVTIISLLLIRQLYHEDGEDREEGQWNWHGHFGVVTYIFILLILCLYFIDPALA